MCSSILDDEYDEQQAGQEQKHKPKYATTPEQLVFYTDTTVESDSDKEYPIYILPTHEIFLKKRPAGEIEATLVVNVSSGDRTPIRNMDELVNLINSIGMDEKTAELAKTAFAALKTLSSFAIFARVYNLRYEVYRGDYSQYVGEVNAKVLRLMAYSKFSTGGDQKKAWAIAYGAVKRLSTKYPELSRYIYPEVICASLVTDTDIQVYRRCGYHSKINIKIPILSEEFVKVYNTVITQKGTDETRALEEEIKKLEEEISKLEEALNKKKEELNTLRARLEALKMKSTIESLKTKIIEEV